MAGPVARARGMDRKIAVGTNEFRECPEALPAYQHTKAEAVLQREGYRFLPQCASRPRNYLISTVAMPSNFLAMAAASSFEMFSFRGLGAPSTRSLASFKPRAVTSRTALMVEILFAPASLRMTVNSVFSSTGAAAAAPPPAAGAATAAAAETPRRSSSFFTNAEASSRLRDTI